MAEINEHLKQMVELCGNDPEQLEKRWKKYKEEVEEKKDNNKNTNERLGSNNDVLDK